MHDADLRIPDPIEPLEPERPVQPVSRAFGNINDTALAYARRHGLLEDDGQIHCWECKRLGATLPSLHCKRCYAIVRARPAKPMQPPAPAPEPARPPPRVVGRGYKGPP